MNERRILFGSNWKMHKTVSEAISYTRRLLQEIERLPGLDQIQVFVVPPYTAIAAVKQESGGRLWVGAQNMHWAESGPYTGEISAPMLKELDVDLVELGHAERRQHFGETDSTINQKLHMALRFGLRALICIGEQLDQKVSGVGRESVARQLRAILAGVPDREAGKLIVAYEPVWAIGEDGTTADAHYVRLMCDYIRGVVAQAFGPGPARDVRVIYGGDVKATNAGEILGQGGVDGLFIGRAAWQAEGFVSLIRACLSVY
jgi:triosephosphate isomerase